MRRSTSLVCVAILASSILSVATAHAAERTKEEIEHAKKLDPEISSDISRQDFLKKYPKAKLVQTEKSVPVFRQYAVTVSGQQNFYVFMGEKFCTHKEYMWIGENADNKLKQLAEKLGKPDYTEVDADEKKEGILQRHRWFIEEANVVVVGTITRERLGPTFVMDVMNDKNIKEAKALRDAAKANAK
jgi:nucleotide-binding universal stress UspA family protein